MPKFHWNATLPKSENACLNFLMFECCNLWLQCVQGTYWIWWEGWFVSLLTDSIIGIADEPGSAPSCFNAICFKYTESHLFPVRSVSGPFKIHTIAQKKPIAFKNKTVPSVAFCGYIISWWNGLLGWESGRNSGFYRCWWALRTKAIGNQTFWLNKSMFYSSSFRIYIHQALMEENHG